MMFQLCYGWKKKSDLHLASSFWMTKGYLSFETFGSQGMLWMLELSQML